jgi:hypothetical protein
MLEAMERVAAKSEESAAVPGTAAAIAQPAATPTTGAPVTEPGPIPFKDHKTILDNTRSKAFQERDAQWNQQLGWARQIQADHAPKLVEFYKAMETDPVAFYQRLGNDLANHPQFSARFRQVATNGGAQPQQGSLDPDVEVMGGDGRVVGKTFSADRVKAIVDDAVQKAITTVRGEVAPLRDFHQRQIVDQQTREYQQSLETHADTLMNRVDKIVGVTKDAQGKPDTRSSQLYRQIDALMAADPTIDVIDAALQVREQMVPQETEATRHAVAEEMRRKANGNTANGAAAGASPLARPRNEKELARWMSERSGATA